MNSSTTTTDSSGLWPAQARRVSFGPACSRSTTSAPQGTPEAGAARSEQRRFRLQGRRPDAHLPYEYQYRTPKGGDKWEALELYDEWLHGAILRDPGHDALPEIAEHDPESDESSVEVDLWDRIADDEDEPRGDASRVTVLLHNLLYGHYGEFDQSGLNARLPAASQLDKFAECGWDRPPTVADLIKLRVQKAEREHGFDRSDPELRWKVFPKSRKGFLARDPDYALWGTSQGRQRDVDPECSDDDDVDSLRGEDAYLDACADDCETDDPIAGCAA